MNKEINHIAMIMDGNRRFAKKKGLESKEGHNYGANKLKEVLEWCKEFKIYELTIYSFSMQNFNRSKDELDYLFNLMKNEFKKLSKEEDKINKAGLKINFLGRLNLLPEDVRKICEEVTEKTKNNSNYKLNICMAYGGREEIIDAVKKIVDEKIPSDVIDEDVIANHLYLNSNPDLVIRTSGEVRTSNFLPWQTIYSEWFFIEHTWPEFSKEDFVNIITEFKEKREIRKGK
ncbi:MAG: polyprenyl diphosphate synthase [Candidatus Woesearchaeota archaeon]